MVGSTDMGNVSYAVPSIHPMIAVAPPHISIHTPEFADFARGDAGDRAVVDGAVALATTIADLWLQPGLLDDARADHAADLERVGGTGVPGADPAVSDAGAIASSCHIRRFKSSGTWAVSLAVQVKGAMKRTEGVPSREVHSDFAARPLRSHPR